MELIGQQHILNKLTSYTLESFPRTILILGEEGSEQDLLIQKVAEHFELDLVEISNKVEDADLIDYTQNPVAKLYHINLTDFTEKQQNQFLKFIEEPSDSVYIILTAESTIGILPTILNRCIKLYCNHYTKEQLEQASWLMRNPNELVYKVCRTPGQLYEAEDGDKVTALYELCSKIITFIKKASYSNTLTLVSKINCDKDDTKFDFKQFFNMMEYVSFTKFLEDKDQTVFNIYTYVNKTKQTYVNKTVKKDSFMLNFLDGLWRLTH